MWGSQYNAIITWIGDAANIEKIEERNKERTCGTAPKDVINNTRDKNTVNTIVSALGLVFFFDELTSLSVLLFWEALSVE